MRHFAYNVWANWTSSCIKNAVQEDICDDSPELHNDSARGQQNVFGSLSTLSDYRLLDIDPLSFVMHFVVSFFNAAKQKYWSFLPAQNHVLPSKLLSGFSTTADTRAAAAVFATPLAQWCLRRYPRRDLYPRHTGRVEFVV